MNDHFEIVILGTVAANEAPYWIAASTKPIFFPERGLFLVCGKSNRNHSFCFDIAILL